MSKNKELAQKFVATAAKYGWIVSRASGCLVTIEKSIKKDDMEDFVKADGEYYFILGVIPQTSPGSTWGTDGGGVGALSAVKNGRMVMNRSGLNRNVVKAVAKLI